MGRVLIHAANAACKWPLLEPDLHAQGLEAEEGSPVTRVCEQRGQGALQPGLQLFSAACWSDMWRCYKHARGCAEAKLYYTVYIYMNLLFIIMCYVRKQRAFLCSQTSHAQPLTIKSAGSNKVTLVQSVSANSGRVCLCPFSNKVEFYNNPQKCNHPYKKQVF